MGMLGDREDDGNEMDESQAAVAAVARGGGTMT